MSNSQHKHTLLNMLQLNPRIKAQLTNTTIVQAENQSNQDVMDMLRKKQLYKEGLLQQIRENQERRMGMLGRKRDVASASADVRPGRQPSAKRDTSAEIQGGYTFQIGKASSPAANAQPRKSLRMRRCYTRPAC